MAVAVGSGSMNERRRPSGRRDRQSTSGVGTGGRARGRRSRGDREGKANDATRGGGVHDGSTAEETRPRRRRKPPPPEHPPQQRSYPQPPKADSRNAKSSSSSNKQGRRSKKEIHASVQSSVIDALDNLKTYTPTNFTTSRTKYKKLSSSKDANDDDNNADFSNATSRGGAFHAAAARSPSGKKPQTITTSASYSNHSKSTPINRNSRQRPRAHNATPNNNRRARNRNNVNPQHHQLQPYSSTRLDNRTQQQKQPRHHHHVVVESISNKAATAKVNNSASQTRETTTTTKKKSSRRVVDNLIPPRLQNDLQTRRRVALDVSYVYDEDGGVECDVSGLGHVDPTLVYGCQLSPSQTNVESSSTNDVVVGEEITKMDKLMEERNNTRLGKNGWHRALELINNPPPTTSMQAKSSYASETASSSLDQLTVSHILEHVHPQVNEMDAIHEEYDYLRKEIRSLEKDRVQLEQQFHEAGRICSQKSMKEQMTYQTFRTNLRYMKNEDMKLLPLMWLEDLPLSSSSSENGKKPKLYSKLDKPFQDLIRNHRGVGLALLIADPQCKASLVGRYYMSSNYGIEQHMSSSAMLKREKAATLIDEGGESLRHCAITGFDNNATATGDNDNAKFGDTTGSSVDRLGTTYFLKYDSGTMHHRGDLPSNLRARLVREKKDSDSIKYLSTGCSYSVGRGNRCYYAEFDNGECWWGTNKDDVLDKIFTEMDVHRVAFGGSSTSGSASSDKSSWCVIGKNGLVRWRNVPQGLHDVLITQDARVSATAPNTTTAADNSVLGRDHTAAAPCEVSLGIGGTYFIRFLDGRVDYSLPNFVADVFDKFEADGKLIRSVALHVDTYDCLIRYSI